MGSRLATTAPTAPDDRPEIDMRTQRRLADARYILAATLGACLFWSALADVARPVEPHPGLKDEALKRALRDDRSHTQLSYMAARKHLFNDVDGNGREVECAYTGEKIEFFVQPLPDDALMEHTWPLTRLPAEARTDLHHLFAVSSESRLARLNLHYGRVLVPVWSHGGSRSGPSRRGMPVFEVRRERRGDISRAMFYVATMYGLSIPEAEEARLRLWHDEDPVDAAEKARNARVAKHQTSRNPFVDHPTLTRRISDF